jgi:hypothetical protein
VQTGGGELPGGAHDGVTWDMQQSELGRNASDEEPHGQRGDQDPGHSGKEKQAPVQPAGLRSISARGKLRPSIVRRTHWYGVATAGCGVRSGV